MATYRIGVLNGDDIGLEIVPVAVNVLKAALARHPEAQVEWVPLPIGYTSFVEHGKSLPTLEAKKDYLVGLKLMSELERYLDNILSAWGKAQGNVDSVRSFFEEALPTDDACFDARSRSAENFRNRLSSLVRPRETLMENAMRILQDVPGTAEQKESWSYCADYLQGGGYADSCWRIGYYPLSR